MTAAAVFLNHLARRRNFDLGYRSDHVLLVTLDPARSGYKREQLAAPYQELLARMQTIPQVRPASISGCTPLEGCGSGGRYLIAEGHVEGPEDRRRTIAAFVAPRYFETMGIPLVGGRDFDFRDAGRPRVAIVNRAMARRYIMFQERQLQHQFELGTTVEPEAVAGTVREMVRDVLKSVPVKTVTTLADQVGLEHCSRASDGNALRVFRLPGRRARRHRPI